MKYTPLILILHVCTETVFLLLFGFPLFSTSTTFPIAVVIENEAVSKQFVDRIIKNRVNYNYKLPQLELTYDYFSTTSSESCSGLVKIIQQFCGQPSYYGIVSVGGCEFISEMHYLTSKLNIPNIAVKTQLCELEISSNNSLTSASPYVTHYINAAVAITKQHNAKSTMIYFDNDQSLSIITELQNKLTKKGVETFIHQIQTNQTMIHHMQQNIKKKVHNIITLTNRNNALYLLQQGNQSNILQQNYFWIILNSAITPNDILTIVPNDANVGLIRTKTYGIETFNECQLLSVDVFHDCQLNNINSQEVETVNAIEAVAKVLNDSQHLLNYNNNMSCNLDSLESLSNGWQIYKQFFKIKNYVTPNGIISFNTSEQSMTTTHMEFITTFNMNKKSNTKMVKSALFNTQSETVDAIYNVNNLPQLYPNKFTNFKNETLTLCKPYRNETYIPTVIQILSKLLNFNYIIIEPPDGQYGGPKSNTTIFSGCVGELQLGNALLGTAFFTKTEIRDTVVDFSYPLFEEQNAFMLPNPKNPSKMWNIFRPLKYDSWCLIVVFVAISAFFTYIFAHFSPMSAWNLGLEGSIADEIWFQEYVWSAIGSFLQQGQDFYPSAMSARVVMAFWWFFTVIIFASYTADLTSYLTTTDVIDTEPIKTLEELVNSDIYKPIGSAGTNLESLLKNAKSGIYKKLGDKISFFDSYDRFLDKCNNHIVRNNYACVDDQTALIEKASNDCHEVFILAEKFNTATLAFLYPEDAYFAEVFDYYMGKMSETGAMQLLVNSLVYVENVCELNKKQTQISASEIELETFLGVAIISLSFQSIGFLIFGIEMFWVRIFKRRVTDVYWYKID